MQRRVRNKSVMLKHISFSQGGRSNILSFCLNTQSFTSFNRWLTELVFPGMAAIPHEELLEWTKNGYIWFDWFSVPQVTAAEGGGNKGDASLPDYYLKNAGMGGDAKGKEKTLNELVADAVDSIPAYIERCDLMLVPCPPVDHSNFRDKHGYPVINDYASWRSRGWCRCESIARLLARLSGPIIVLNSMGSQPWLLPPYDAWSVACGRGDFTCCQRDHKVAYNDPKTGEKSEYAISCDKPKVKGGLEKTCCFFFVSSLSNSLSIYIHIYPLHPQTQSRTRSHSQPLSLCLSDCSFHSLTLTPSHFYSHPHSLSLSHPPSSSHSHFSIANSYTYTLSPSHPLLL